MSNTQMNSRNYRYDSASFTFSLFFIYKICKGVLNILLLLFVIG